MVALSIARMSSTIYTLVDGHGCIITSARVKGIVRITF